jgi:hypothetical protein
MWVLLLSVPQAGCKRHFFARPASAEDKGAYDCESSGLGAIERVEEEEE